MIYMKTNNHGPLIGISTRMKFSTTCILRMEDENESGSGDSDSNSNLTVVSYKSVDSETSDIKGKFKETERRLKHYLKESWDTRVDLKSISNDFKTQLDEQSEKLTSEQKKIHDTYTEEKYEEYKGLKGDQHETSGGGLDRRVITSEKGYIASSVMVDVLNWRNDYLRKVLGTNISSNDLNGLDVTKSAQDNVHRDLIIVLNYWIGFFHLKYLIKKLIKRK